MIDKKKVINGLKECDLNGGFIGNCPYKDEILSLLKEQEARVMALDELTEIYVEFKGNNCPVRLTNFDLQKILKHAVDGDCRLWTGKPTDEQRQAVKWE